MSTLRVAAAQFELRSEPSLEAFLTHVEALTRQAVESGAELLVLPELASTGLLGSITDHTVTTATVSADYWGALAALDGGVRDGLAHLARRYGLTLLGGSHNRLVDGSLRNTAYLVYPDGRLEAQDKLHLTPPEIAMGTRPGDELLLSRIGPFTAAVLICADIQYPELSRYLAGQGVNLILCPSLTWNRRGLNRVRIGGRARAMENQLYVVMSPLVGSSGLPADAPLFTVGSPFIAGPIDRRSGTHDGLVARAETHGEQLLVADLDTATIEASRAHPETPGLALRRPDLYERLAAGTGPAS